MALVTHNPKRLSLGEALPRVTVATTDGHVVSPRPGKNGLVVVFTCNHCPYAVSWEDRTIALAELSLSKGIDWLAINPNAANKQYPDDSIEEMRRRVAEKKYPYPYAADDTQAAAAAFGAACTPEYFLFDSAGMLRYTGRLDDSQDSGKVTQHFLADALADLMAGMKIRLPESHPMGCSIKWMS